MNPGPVVKHMTEVYRSVWVISHGRGVTVLQSAVDYEKAEEERDFVRAVAAGLADLEAKPSAIPYRVSWSSLTGEVCSLLAQRTPAAYSYSCRWSIVKDLRIP